MSGTCSTHRAGAPVVVEMVAAPSAATSADSPIRNGIRLVYGVSPSGAATFDAAFAAVLKRLARIDGGLGIAIQRSGARIVVDVGDADENKLQAIKRAMTPVRLWLVALDDESNRLAQSASSPPTDIHLRHEIVPDDRGGRDLVFAWTPALPTEKEARERLRRWVVGAGPGNGRFGFGPAADENGHAGIRSYALGARELHLSVTEAEPSTGDLTGVRVGLAPASAAALGALTAALVGKRVGIVLDDVVSSAPTVMSEIDGGRITITLGSSDETGELAREASELAAKLRFSDDGPELVLLSESLIGR